MVAAKGKGEKSAFITGVLKSNPTANPAAVNKAWSESGRKGSVSVTLVQKIRSDMGLSGNLRQLPGGSRSNGVAESYTAPKTQTPKKPARKPDGQSNGAVELCRRRRSHARPTRTGTAS